MHNLILTNQGEVYSWGNNDSLQLGRTETPKQPGLIDLKTPVDLISAGEVHSFAANSKTGQFFLWGKFKSMESVIFKSEKIVEQFFYIFKRQGI